MMKLFKFFTAGALMLGAVSVANAQEDASNADSMAISFGVKGGVNFANLNGGDIGETKSRTSFHVGGLVEFPLSEMFSIQAEALYSGQGFELNDSGEPLLDDDSTTEYQLDYINVPVLAKVYLFKGFSLEAGPQFSFLISEEIDTDPSADAGDTDTDVVETFDFGVAGGLTFQTEMGLFATARYNQGLTNIIKDSEENVTNAVFQIGIGYKF